MLKTLTNPLRFLLGLLGQFLAGDDAAHDGELDAVGRFPRHSVATSVTWLSFWFLIFQPSEPNKQKLVNRERSEPSGELVVREGPEALVMEDSPADLLPVIFPHFVLPSADLRDILVVKWMMS